MNLCTNAYQAMGDTIGVLTVGLYEVDVSDQYPVKGMAMPSGKYLKLEVRDTGPGIEEDTMMKIFDPYFTTKKLKKGTGSGVIHG